MILSALLQKKSNNTAKIVMFSLCYYQGLAPLALLFRPVRAGEFDAINSGPSLTVTASPFGWAIEAGKGAAVSRYKWIWKW
ncbi:hypothetical protein [Cyclobacterium amurskyense]|uniref:hypothetical protein n=1 Tax=Cyclobacterium amurskyense TaxID=320787 RepID=UPI0030D87DBA